MLEDDIYVTNNFICKSDPSQGSLDAWNRLKKELEELSKTPTNKPSFQFPKLVDVTTEVYGRLNKKHLPWNGSAIVAVRETYSIVAGNKKR